MSFRMAVRMRAIPAAAAAVHVHFEEEEVDVSTTYPISYSRSSSLSLPAAVAAAAEAAEAESVTVSAAVAVGASGAARSPGGRGEVRLTAEREAAGGSPWRREKREKEIVKADWEERCAEIGELSYHGVPVSMTRVGGVSALM